MKYLAILLTFLLSANLYAEDVTYWVGKSSCPDPIVRHQEALINALIEYLNSIQPKGETNYETLGGHSCKMETISSVTNEGMETLTIAIGTGVLVNLYCFSESLLDSNQTESIITFKILYQGEQNKSLHEYKIIEYGQASGIYRSFSYNCKYESIGK